MRKPASLQKYVPVLNISLKIHRLYFVSFPVLFPGMQVVVKKNETYHTFDPQKM